MRLTSNILTGMDVCLDSVPAGSVFSALTGETETCKPYLGHFCQVYFCTRVNEKGKNIYCATQLQPTNAALHIVPLLAC